MGKKFTDKPDPKGDRGGAENSTDGFRDAIRRAIREENADEALVKLWAKRNGIKPIKLAPDGEGKPDGRGRG